MNPINYLFNKFQCIQSHYCLNNIILANSFSINQTLPKYRAPIGTRRTFAFITLIAHKMRGHLLFLQNTSQNTSTGDETTFQNARQNVMLGDAKPETVGRANALQKL